MNGWWRIVVMIAGVLLPAGLAHAQAPRRAASRSPSASRPATTAAAPPARRSFGIDVDTWFLSQIPDNATAFNAIDQDYPDLFGPGTGGGGSAAVPFTLVEPASDLEVSLGPALTFDSVVFGGEVARDLVGGTFEADDMSAGVLLAAVQIRLLVGRHDAAARVLFGLDLGVGAVFWPDVGATLTLPGPPTLVASGDLYEASTGFAWRATIRLGLQWRLGESIDLTTTGFLGIGGLAAPQDVDDPANPFVPADPAPMRPLIVGFAIGFRWRGPAAAR